MGEWVTPSDQVEVWRDCQRPSQFEANRYEGSAVSSDATIREAKRCDHGQERNVPVQGAHFDFHGPGSRIRIKIKNKRKKGGPLGFPILWKVNQVFTASQDYNNFEDWFLNNNIASVLEANAITENCTGPNFITPSSNFPQPYAQTDAIFCTIRNIGGLPYFSFQGTDTYNNKENKLEVRIEVLRADNLIVFESDPQDAEPDLWYESSESFGITADGEHLGNTQDQDFATNTPGIVKTDFFNCFAFGNGVESYKIEDSIAGKELVLGNRATTTDSEVYGEERRFSDLTYSGVYNPESNINRLNEFNLGLLNFKPLEMSYGPIMKLFPRETDILTLQEDKISYDLLYLGKELKQQQKLYCHFQQQRLQLYS